MTAPIFFIRIFSLSNVSLDEETSLVLIINIKHLNVIWIINIQCSSYCLYDVFLRLRGTHCCSLSIFFIFLSCILYLIPLFILILIRLFSPLIFFTFLIFLHYSLFDCLYRFIFFIILFTIIFL